MTAEDARARFSEFVQARTAALWHVAYLLTGDRHSAEDLLQIAFERAAIRWDQLEQPEAYVRRVLYTQTVSWWRSRQRRVKEVLVDSTPEPAGSSSDPETRIVLAQALQRLTPKQRAVLVLRYYEDRSEEETARQLDVTVGTVKSQAKHALRRLRQLAPELAPLFSDQAQQRNESVVTR